MIKSGAVNLGRNIPVRAHAARETLDEIAATRRTEDSARTPPCPTKVFVCCVELVQFGWSVVRVSHVSGRQTALPRVLHFQ